MCFQMEVLDWFHSLKESFNHHSGISFVLSSNVGWVEDFEKFVRKSMLVFLLKVSNLTSNVSTPPPDFSIFAKEFALLYEAARCIKMINP